MNIAIVFYGQPRDYLKGYNNIIQFIKTQHDCKFDFFYHCWVLDENEHYKCSPWKNIDDSTLLYNKDIITHLQKLYNPISHEIENQNCVILDDSLYNNTIAFKNTKGLKLSNINNTLFQMYSRNKARNVLKKYLDKNCTQYDFVMMLRFDINEMPHINFNALNKQKVYVSNLWYYHNFRKIIPDNCIITPTNIFLEWFNIYDTLKDILDNTQLMYNVNRLNEDFEINAEQLIFSKYILHYHNTDNILYFEKGF